MTTLAEILQKMEQDKYELAVWTALENHLCPYIDMDEHRRAEAGMKIRGCTESYVPHEVLERVLEVIREEKINPLLNEIEKIESLTVEEPDAEEETPRKKKKTRRKGAGQKRVRAIPTRNRRKDKATG